MEKISVVVPIYNVERYVHRCIDSIINQTYTNLEIILVDDGSPDNCPEICDEYASLDERIRVIHKTNGGLSDARNVGIAIATGTYIGFVDSDDYIALDMYEHLYEQIVKNNADISICGTIAVYPDILPTMSDKRTNLILDSKEAIREMLEEENFNTSAWDKLYRIELFNDIRYPLGRLSEDLFITYKLFHKAGRIAFSSESKYFYVQTPGSIMRSTFNLRKLDTLVALEEMKMFLKSNYPELLGTLRNRYVRYNFAYYRQMLAINSVDRKTMMTLRNNIQVGIYGYLFSKYKWSNKIAAALLALNEPLFNWLYGKASSNKVRRTE